MVIELVRSRAREPRANPDLVAMLKEVLQMAEAGELQAAAVVYVHNDMPLICYEADGHEASISCAARQLEEEMRSVMFDDADAV